MKRFVLIAGLALSRLCFADYVCIGTEKHCEQVARATCAAELRKPAAENLYVPVGELVIGPLTDQTGNPIGSPGALLLKGVPGQRLIRTATPDKDGKFDLGRITAGRYRLLPVQMVDGKVRRLAPFNPPAMMKCEGSNPCELQVQLVAGATDQATDTCPPR